MNKELPIRDPLILGNKSLHDITVEVARPVEGKANKYWWVLFSLSLGLFLWGLVCITYTIGTGIGVWGLNRTVSWAWDITNFVWWIGIGHDTNTGEPARKGGLSSCRKGFLIFASRFSKMGMNIYQTWRNDLSLTIYPFDILWRCTFSHFSNDPVLHKNGTLNFRIITRIVY